MSRYTVNGDVVTEEIANSAFMTKVYQWMMIGVLITGALSLVVSQNQNLVQMFIMNSIVRWTLIIAQFGLVIAISGFMHKLSAMTASLMFIVYSAITGITLSVIFLAFTMASIQSAFFTTAIGFAGLTVFGYTTKKDLGPVGSFCMMGLFGVLGIMFLSFFFPSMMGGSMELIINMAMLLIFSGLIAYDTQAIKLMGQSAYSEEDRSKATILGALKLYLDFINLFITILRLTGDRRR
jgi:FtsH-binding integral membrane protein